jgi:hypothetical protein
MYFLSGFMLHFFHYPKCIKKDYINDLQIVLAILKPIVNGYELESKSF